MIERADTNASQPSPGKRLLVIDPVTRVEGHGKVTIYLDEKMRVSQTRFHIVEFRGFERFIQGRLFWEVPVIVQRLCGICPVSHHLAAAKAMDWIVGGEHLTPTAEKIRRLMHYAQILQSHATHLFYLAFPDLLFGFDAPPESRSIWNLAKRDADLAKKGILLRQFGQEILEATYGKRIHGTGAVPGGVNKNLPVPQRDAFLARITPVIRTAYEAVSFVENYITENYASMTGFGVLDTPFLSTVGRQGSLDLYDGTLRAVDNRNNVIFEGVPCSDYRTHIAEEVRDWSYMKFPFLTVLGPEAGWYRVGPLARINVCSFIDTAMAEEQRKKFFKVLGTAPVQMTMAYHWARMVELLHAAEKIEQLLYDTDLQGMDLRTRGNRREEAYAVVEAPRGTLLHHYRVSPADQVTMANLIVSTTQNNGAMNRSVHQVVVSEMEGRSSIPQGMFNRVEAVIRAYDPCLSCATHAVGQMALTLELYDHKGECMQRMQRRTS